MKASTSFEWRESYVWWSVQLPIGRDRVARSGKADTWQEAYAAAEAAARELEEYFG